MMQSSQSRIDYLDGIRALAIGCVLVVHWISSQFPIGYGGYIGVDIFFVLSGYIITTILWRSRSEASGGRQWGRFMWRRIMRLYPALIGMVVGTLLIFAVVPSAPLTVGELSTMAIVALTQLSFVVQASDLGPLGPFSVTWSLAVEWLFYILWPVALLLSKRSHVRTMTLARWTAGIAAGMYALALFQEPRWFYFGPMTHVPELLAGGVLALVLVTSRLKGVDIAHRRLAEIAAVGLIGLVIAYAVFGPVQW